MFSLLDPTHDLPYQQWNWYDGPTLKKIQSKCPSAYVYQQPTDYSHLSHTDELKDI